MQRTILFALSGRGVMTLRFFLDAAIIKLELQRNNEKTVLGHLSGWKRSFCWQLLLCSWPAQLIIAFHSVPDFVK
jgi:hypothetical protein